jgi:hypothetical protein
MTCSRTAFPSLPFSEASYTYPLEECGLIPQTPELPRRLLVVGEEGPCSDRLESYASELARRIGGQAVVLHLVPDVRGQPASDGPLLSCTPSQPGLIAYRARMSEAGTAVDRVCCDIKRIEFILTASRYALEALSETATVPVFHASGDTASTQGECIMGNGSNAATQRPLVKTAVLGVLSAMLYGVLFWKADAIMSMFTRGGMFAILPIGAAVIFSFAHGMFASSLWSLLGIHARTSSTTKAVAPTARPARKAQRPRAYAYVNPFHNISLRKE